MVQGFRGLEFRVTGLELRAVIEDFRKMFRDLSVHALRFWG